MSSKFDLIVIGSGPAGRRAAIQAAIQKFYHRDPRAFRDVQSDLALRPGPATPTTAGATDRVVPGTEAEWPAGPSERRTR